jgi:hypothetical protein
VASSPLQRRAQEAPLSPSGQIAFDFWKNLQSAGRDSSQRFVQRRISRTPTSTRQVGGEVVCWSSFRRVMTLELLAAQCSGFSPVPSMREPLDALLNALKIILSGIPSSREGKPAADSVASILTDRIYAKHTRTYLRLVAAGPAPRRATYPTSSKAREESNQFALSMRGCFCKDRLELIASRNFGNAQFFRCSLRIEAFGDNRG